MGTRFYLPSSGTAPANPSYSAGWSHTAAAFRAPLVTSKTDTALGTTTYTKGAGNQKLLGQFVSSDTLSAGAVSGTAQIAIACGATNSGESLGAFVQVRIKVVSGDGNTERGALYSGQAATTASTTSTDPNYQFPNAADYTATVVRVLDMSLSSVTAQAGDRLVVEVGYYHTYTGALDRRGLTRFGDPASSTDQPATVNSATPSNAAWVEFSQSLFTPPTPTGALAATLPALAANLSGGYTPPLITGALAASLPALTGALSGTYTPGAGETIPGTLAATLPALTANLAGGYTAPVPSITGALAATLPPLTAALTGQVWVTAEADTGDRRNGRTRTGLAYAVVDPALDTHPAREPVRLMAQSVPAPTLVDGRPQ